MYLSHRINADEVLELISTTLKEIVRYAKTDRKAFINSVQDTLSSKQVDEIKGKQKCLVSCQKRKEELEILTCKIYENNALGKLPEKGYLALSTGYDNESNTLE